MPCANYFRRDLLWLGGIFCAVFAFTSPRVQAQAPSPRSVSRIQALATVFPLSEGRAAIHRTPVRVAPLPSRDEWLSFDKAQHFTFGFLLTVGGQYTLVNKANLSEGAALPASIGFSAGIGLAKEVYDARRPGGTGFSYKDLAWDALGIAAASLLIAL